MIISRQLQPLTKWALILGFCLTTGCQTSNIITRTDHKQRYVPGRHSLKNSDYAIPCYEPPFYGYNGTCWRTWPSDWVACPEEIIEEHTEAIDPNSAHQPEVVDPSRTAQPGNGNSEITPPSVTQPDNAQPGSIGPAISQPLPGEPPRPNPQPAPSPGPDMNNGAGFPRLNATPGRRVPIAPPVAE